MDMEDEENHGSDKMWNYRAQFILSRFFKKSEELFDKKVENIDEMNKIFKYINACLELFSA